MDQSLIDILTNAATTKELVSIIYHGGRQPGTIREIRVISIKANDMQAHDVADPSGNYTTFKGRDCKTGSARANL